MEADISLFDGVKYFIENYKEVSRFEVGANIALFSSSPEMLEALKEIINLQGKLANQLPFSENELKDWGIANYNARLAIAKAEGE